ncbi:UDP-glucose 4-epimerase GalE [Lysobacter sp. LF1]|uniref:UDP-glucose 4-epimerase n=1 Tax=Lysobacter stagni TaxID=3045172 RepID=A0ABT6XFP1_9GAMM|nr:UDP-glucose 4-epimerase GalE [Lysobacter sp. LF1]MDI9238961.1 UDP-glucose 4-epimerase GalE [Lysobacter sp. LF1]
MHILVCGGAGYVGSHAVSVLAEQGHRITVLDNLSTGHREAVRWGRLVDADLMAPTTLDRAFEDPVDAVMHFCARSLVAESLAQPYAYYQNNVAGTLHLLEAMQRHGVERIVFSSTAAVFGHPQAMLIDEAHPKAPINPYGASKWMVEEILRHAAQARGLRSVALRYFNAAGAAPERGIGESHSPETHLIPNVLRSALGTGPRLKVFGHDYPTPDGTCVRDYVHVLDLADAHVLALDLMEREPGAHAFNLGNGTGFSVLQVIETARRVTGRGISFDRAPRRAGDPAYLVASSEKARDVLGWSPRHSALETIIDSAWRWHLAPAF